MTDEMPTTQMRWNRWTGELEQLWHIQDCGHGHITATGVYWNLKEEWRPVRTQKEDEK